MSHRTPIEEKVYWKMTSVNPDGEEEIVTLDYDEARAEMLAAQARLELSGFTSETLALRFEPVVLAVDVFKEYKERRDAINKARELLLGMWE